MKNPELTNDQYQVVIEALKMMPQSELLTYKHQLFMEIEDRQIIINAANELLETRAMWGEKS